MKYDDAEYCFLNFETDLPNEAGGTHTGMYLAWAASRHLLGDGFDEATLAPLQARAITGRQLYFDQCDGKLTDDDFSDDGNAFTASYYEQHFVADYRRVFQADLPNGGESTDDFCSLPDTWENYDRLAPVLDQRYAQWRQPQASPRPALALVEDPSEAAQRPRAPAGPGPRRAGDGAPRPASAAPAARTRDEPQPAGKVGMPAVLSLLVGAAGFILLLLATSFAKGPALQLVAALLGAVAAFGAYRCSLGLGKASATAAVIGALAFVPVLGSFVCLWLVLQVYRSRSPD